MASESEAAGFSPLDATPSTSRDPLSERIEDDSSDKDGEKEEVYTKLPNCDALIRKWADLKENEEDRDFHYSFALRCTLMYLLDEKCGYLKKERLLGAYKLFCTKFVLENFKYLEVFHEVQKIADEPWENLYFSWKDVFAGTLSVTDTQVLLYFRKELEEIVTARICFLHRQRKLQSAWELAKLSFLYHCRITNHLRFCYTEKILMQKDRLGHSSAFEYVKILGTLFHYNSSEALRLISLLTYHEVNGIILNVYGRFPFRRFSQVVVQETIVKQFKEKTENDCCLSNLLGLFCMVHKKLNTSIQEFRDIAKYIVDHSKPSSYQLYIFTLVLYKAYGLKCLVLYIEFYVRALSSDINYLEHMKDIGTSTEVSSIEEKIACMFETFSIFFTGSLSVVARECVFSAFNLTPTEKRLQKLKSLSQDVLSNAINKKSKFVRDCKEDLGDCICRIKCKGPCKTREYNFNPLLDVKIEGVKKETMNDLINVLEYVRKVPLRYNYFNWKNGYDELEKHLTLFNMKNNPVSDNRSFSTTSNISKSPSLESMPSAVSFKIPKNTQKPKKGRKKQINKSKPLYGQNIAATKVIHSNIECQNSTLHSIVRNTTDDDPLTIPIIEKPIMQNTTKNAMTTKEMSAISLALPAFNVQNNALVESNNIMQHNFEKSSKNSIEKSNAMTFDLIKNIIDVNTSIGVFKEKSYTAQNVLKNSMVQSNEKSSTFSSCSTHEDKNIDADSSESSKSMLPLMPLTKTRRYTLRSKKGSEMHENKNIDINSPILKEKSRIFDCVNDKAPTSAEAKSRPTTSSTLVRNANDDIPMTMNDSQDQVFSKPDQIVIRKMINKNISIHANQPSSIKGDTLKNTTIRTPCIISKIKSLNSITATQNQELQTAIQEASSLQLSLSDKLASTSNRNLKVQTKTYNGEQLTKRANQIDNSEIASCKKVCLTPYTLNREGNQTLKHHMRSPVRKFLSKLHTKISTCQK